MTGKRYKLHYNYHFGYGVEDTYNSDRLYLDEFELLVDELNTLNDGNKQLKEEIEDLKAVIKDVEYQRDYVHTKYDECRKCVKELFEKNEQLKKQLNAFKPVLFEDANNGGSSMLYEKELKE